MNADMNEIESKLPVVRTLSVSGETSREGTARSGFNGSQASHSTTQVLLFRVNNRNTRTARARKSYSHIHRIAGKYNKSE